MDLDSIQAGIEADLNWRWDEMRFHRNILNSLREEKDKLVYRKSMVVILYAHYEGFCKVAFTTYASEINKAKLKCGDVNDFITAATLDDLFTALLNPHKKCDIFRNSLPEDKVVHRLSTQVSFISGINKVWERDVVIPVDTVVDTESNLSPIVLRKILFRLGFPHNAFVAYDGKINQLLKIRNSVAHGTMMSGVGERVYENLEEACKEIFDAVKTFVWEALKNKQYKQKLSA